MPAEVTLRTLRRLVAGAVVIAALVGVVALVVARSGAVPDGPVDVAWNRAPCAHCRMLVGEPAHAAQLITADGEVLDFDDPGCLLRYEAEVAPAVHRIWFHHGTEPRWLGGDEVGFRTGALTPMGFGLVAVDRGAPGAIDLDEARARLAAAAPAVAP